VILLGATLVITTYTFPLWQRYISLLPGGTGVVLPCLPPQASEAFLLLDEPLQASLLALADDDLTQACNLIVAHLTPDNVVPAAQQDAPQGLPSGERIGDGRFTPAADVVEAEGALSIFELADGRRLFRIDGLDVTNVPDMELWLTANRSPTTREELEAGGEFQLIDQLQGNVGSQNYIVAADSDLTRYNSVVLYSETLDIVVSYADLLKF